ncbi:MAG: ferredoxin--NADP reductase [Lewinellaceae bacterium]|nr:ferredoxin--NADP reductase [Lewinellaceae bacterium]
MEQKRHWRISSKNRETPDSVTLRLEPTDGRPVAYLPGQYLPLIRTINGREERRAYSFSSCPGLDNQPAITIKRVPNGLFSNWLVQDSQPGDLLLSAAPAGQFLLPTQAPRHLIYLAAGSGITPIFSHLKKLLELGLFPDTSIALFYANRDSANTIFKKQIDQWVHTLPGRFSCTYFLSREKAVENALFRHLGNALFERETLRALGGKLTPGILKNTQIYLCAPVALMRMAQMTLGVLDFPKENIHQETFVPERQQPLRTIDTSQTHHIVVTDRTGARTEFDIYAGETILNGALRQGIDLPYTCKTGVCLSCLARCVHGNVEVQFVELTRREGPGALINTCIGYPVSPMVELVYD